MIHTSKLILTRTEDSDFPHFFELDTDAEVLKFIKAPAKSEQESRERFQKLLDYNARFLDRGAFTVKTREGEFVGFGYMINIELNPQNPDHEVGYRLSKSFWGKGLATEIALALIDYGFKNLKLSSIYGTTHPDHIVSQKVLIKAGLKDLGAGSYYNGCRIFKIENPAL